MLILVRHGRTAANASGLLLGRLDVALDEVGAQQAALLARALGSVARVVTSPLERARATATAVAHEADVTVEVDERWIELDYGELDGTPLPDVPAELWASWRRDLGYVPAGGESLAALGERVRSALDDLVADAADRDVVVVSHVSPIKAAAAWALGVGDEITWRLFLAPASITRVSLRGAVPVLQTWNSVAHLDEGHRPAG